MRDEQNRDMALCSSCREPSFLCPSCDMCPPCANESIGEGEGYCHRCIGAVVTYLRKELAKAKADNARTKSRAELHPSPYDLGAHGGLPGRLKRTKGTHP